MGDVFKTVLLVALPASGKSEVRNYLSQIGADRLKEEFHIGENLQLDDFPYVHMMRRIDASLEAVGEERIFLEHAAGPFRDPYDTGTLTCLLNEDFKDLKNSVRVNPASEALYLFDRIDRASVAAGMQPRLAELKRVVRDRIAGMLEAEAGLMRREKESQYTDSFEGKTIVIEFARGGPDGSTMPLAAPFGYGYTFSLLTPEILEEAAALYIYVTPEESRRKNRERANPDDPGSNLFHGVGEEVMYREYGCDDMMYLLEHSEKPHSVTVTATKGQGAVWHLPTGVFDNRTDKTSFLRGEKETWAEDRIMEMAAGIRAATDVMWENYPKDRS